MPRPATRTRNARNTTPSTIPHSLTNGGGETVFCNPPYGKAIAEWVRKCSMEASRKGTLVVMLLPARTDTRWFQQYILNCAEIRFVKGRLHFETNGVPGNPAPFPSMIVVMRTGER
nr:phage N-6-adenine-methyltransferase [Bifidobacterium bifidum]